mmetsp:Transcript_35978/g.107466  ORF Transcript_35978/g.107466 Transcript_35978/m.107466 type:complete len:214 (-) Transcript_35978:506-1147(-)
MGCKPLLTGDTQLSCSMQKTCGAGAALARRARRPEETAVQCWDPSACTWQRSCHASANSWRFMRRITAELLIAAYILSSPASCAIANWILTSRAASLPCSAVMTAAEKPDAPICMPQFRAAWKTLSASVTRPRRKKAKKNIESVRLCTVLHNSGFWMEHSASSRRWWCCRNCARAQTEMARFPQSNLLIFSTALSAMVVKKPSGPPMRSVAKE